MVTDDKLDFWIANNLNVLISGSHGIGKTTILQNAFERNGLTWKYFSTPTIDVWVDLVGVPKEKVNDDGTSSLELIRPIELQDGSIDVIFFDELNRAPAKTRNAVMELIQYKSINGKPIPGLKLVWAAINPSDDDGTYDVEELDPAQMDRFHIQTRMSEEPNRQYFTQKYGDHVGSRACDWWNKLPPDIRPLVSPRRLDYAVEIYKLGGDLDDVITKEALPQTLKNSIQMISTDVSHNTRWLTDPDQYFAELSSRNKQFADIDIVQAFIVLQYISMDMAVTYVGKLPAPKQAILADHEKTLVLMLKALYNNKSKRTITTALTSFNDQYASAAIRLMFKIQIKKADAELSGIVEQCIKQHTNPNHQAWTDLSTLIKHRINDTLIEYDDCIMLIIALGGTPDNPSDLAPEIGATIIQYVIEQYPSQVNDFFKHCPTYICNVCGSYQV